MAEQRMEWKRFCGAVAWPTVVLWGVSLGGVAMSSALTVAGIWPLWLGAVINTVLAYVLFTPMHEAAHGNVRGRRASMRWLEAVVGWTSGFVLLAPFPAFVALHLRHHSNTNDPKRDPDMWVAGQGVASVAARCMTIVPHYYWEFLMGPTARSPAGARARRATVGMVVGIVLVMGVGAWLGVAAWLGWLWVGPAVLASGVLAFAFDWLPHHPHVERARHGNTRPLGAWLGIPMLGQNYHHVHHLYPRVPFYSYGRCLRSGRSPTGARAHARVHGRNAT
ncbi:MAG: fatty acid desaturase [Myxococcota bacterium]